MAQVLVDRAIALAPDPDMRVAPRGIGLTGLDSYFWLADEPRPIVATAAVGGFSVIAEARPMQYLWDFGDGNDKLTLDPGRPWTAERPGNISHLYETLGSYELSVEAIWEARWRVGGGPWTSLGFFSTSDSRTYRVREIVPMLVPAT